ncbi:MAG: ABC transporter ATP-binding protein [Clostridiales bacterium]|nr:ABC transporter ATP-binding protein [Clostridiales bacterium]
MLEINHLYVSFTKDYYTLNDINISLKAGERLTIIGSKESGRTALLRTLVGLEPIAKGEVLYKNIPLERVDPQADITVGYLPANPAFMDNKTVKQNIEYPLKIRKENPAFYEAKVNNALIGLGIDYLKNKKIKELNYLDKVKVALARLSIRNIELFYIDDIFAKISPVDRAPIIKYIKSLIKTNAAAAIIMTEEDEIATQLGYKKKYLKFGSLEVFSNVEA